MTAMVESHCLVERTWAMARARMGRGVFQVRTKDTKLGNLPGAKLSAVHLAHDCLPQL